MIKLTIPELLPSLNRMKIGSHWSAWRSEKKRWTQWVMVAKHNQAHMAGQNPRYASARVEVDRYCRREVTDIDNLFAGLKWLMDGLVANGLLKDDSVTTIGTPVILQVRCKLAEEQRTVVRIYPNV
jgi:hypothetical protein